MPNYLSEKNTNSNTKHLSEEALEAAFLNMQTNN